MDTRSRRIACAATLGMLSVCALPASAIPISINTTALVNNPATFTLNLIDGDGVNNNTARIFNLQTDGQLLGTTCMTGCSTQPPFTLDDSAGLGEFIQELVLGTYLSFDLVFSNVFDITGDGPDLVIGSLLDAGFSLVNTELDAFDRPVPYLDALFVANTADGSVSGARGLTTIPEPGELALLCAGFVALGARRLRKNNRSTRLTHSF